MTELIFKPAIYCAGITLFTACWLAPDKVRGQETGETDTSNITFKKHVLTEEFIAEGVAVGDVNRDGRIDVMAGPYWFEAPHWEKHELAKPEKFYYDNSSCEKIR